MTHAMGKGARKLGAGVEALLTVASASASTVAKSLPAIAGHKEGNHGQHEGKSYLTRDPFDGPRRARVLTSPQRALDTLEPYAKLHLDVYAGKDLCPKDDGMLCKSSDPFVEVYINDVYQGTSCWRAFTNNPTWNYHIVLDVHSPLSIVRVQAMDRDNLSTNDQIGFVEFCVADLELNSEVRGWFELRAKHKHAGLAPLRLREHMRRRDDEEPEPEPEKHFKPTRPSPVLGQFGRMAQSVMHTPATLLPAGHGGDSSSSSSRKAPAAGGAPRPPARSLSLPSVPSIARLQRAPCCGRLPLEEEPPPPQPLAAGAGAGGAAAAAAPAREVAAADAGAEAHAAEAGGSSQELAVPHDWKRPRRRNGGEVRMQLLLEAREEDEWYAFGLPEPEFVFMPNSRLNLAELYTHVLDVKNLCASACQKVVCVPKFLATWQCWPLTLAFFFWWVLAWLWPLEFLPMVLLWCALLLWLLRQEKWNKKIFWHSNVAPLNEDGFDLVASFRDTNRMEAWIVRLLGSLGREASEPTKLRELAGLTFRNGRPVMCFDELVDLLQKERWVRSTSAPRRCQHGHLIVYKGCTLTTPWTCMNHGGCQHPLTCKFKGSVSRYRCESCGIDLCEPCVARRGSLPPAWAGIPAHLLPHGVLVFLTRVEQWADDLHKGVNAAFDFILSIPFDREPVSSLKARWLYSAFVLGWLASTVLLRLVYLISDEAFGFLFRLLCKSFGLLVIGCPLAMRTSFMRSMATQRRANAELSKYRQRRAAGGCATHWAFFKAEAVVAEQRRPSETSATAGGLAAIRVVP